MTVLNNANNVRICWSPPFPLQDRLWIFLSGAFPNATRHSANGAHCETETGMLVVAEHYANGDEDVG